MVDPDKARPDVQGAGELGFVVDLHESRQGDRLGKLMKLGQLVSVQQRHDEQHGVGAHDAGVVDVGRGDGEVLAQYGHVYSRPHLLEVPPATTEMRLVGEHRQARGTARDVSRATRAGSRSGAMSPLEGDRRFTSATSAIGCPRC